MESTKIYTYCSIDVEADGQIPGRNSMLSLGAVLFNDNGMELGEFYRNLFPLPEAERDKETMEWWGKHPEAYITATKNPEFPDIVMRDFVDWLKSYPGKPAVMAYPGEYDWHNFVYWYLVKFVGKSPFSFSCLDLKTYASCILDIPYRDTIKRDMPLDWFTENFPHTHNALDDARGQGYMFFKMREWRKKLKG